MLHPNRTCLGTTAFAELHQDAPALLPQRLVLSPAALKRAIPAVQAKHRPWGLKRTSLLLLRVQMLNVRAKRYQTGVGLLMCLCFISSHVVESCRYQHNHIPLLGSRTTRSCCTLGACSLPSGRPPCLPSGQREERKLLCGTDSSSLAHTGRRGSLMFFFTSNSGGRTVHFTANYAPRPPACIAYCCRLWGL